ncbi:MAG TPA: UDP-N-acetylmuramoyl-L-alanine--D-glutamate ligase [Peptococcaceae bacterium]|nr:UDP-N-acetylmuramoyl-L-alanine--D-glutamate ligase [Peptococcaceae bacterium]
MMFFGKKVLVIGLARSGLATVSFLVKQGARVTANDIKKEEELEGGLQQLKKLPVRLITGDHPPVKQGDYDLIIVSPGVAPTIPPVQEARKLGIPVWSELELAARLIREPIVAVTGTNGKTTTTSLIGHIFQKAGKKAVVAGNIGIPLIQAVEQHRGGIDFWVVEVSSFQLEQVVTFRPKIGVFLNLTPDHLDRHGTLENYGKIKARLFENQGPEDFAVLNMNDAYLRKIAPNLKSRVFWFSRKELPNWGVGVRKDWIVSCFEGREEVICKTSDVEIPGPHNLENALAAVGAALLAGIDKKVIREGLATFPGVAHRLELVRIVNGIKFVNDSKGTNPESVLNALEAFPEEEIILIAGGRAKGSDFRKLALRIKERVKAVVLLGEARPLIKDALHQVGYRKVCEVSSLEEAVRTAAELAQPGDVVLLSPACASWDMFRDFEERGNLFKELVRAL